MAETVILMHILQDPACVLKLSLLYIPAFGWFLKKARTIPIVRQGKKSRASLSRMLMQAEEIFETRRPLVIFPEGTRTSVGEKNLIFQEFSFYITA